MSSKFVKRARSKRRRAKSRDKRSEPTSGGSSSSSQLAYGNFRSPATVVPDCFYVKLKYADQFILNPTATSTDNYVFRANSGYDPNYTGTGHQPYGYDQMTTLWTNWVVEKCTLTFTPTPPNLSTATPQINNAILYITKRRTDPTGFADVNTAIEDPFCVKYVMTSGYQKQPKLRATINNPQFLGVSKEVYLNSSEYSGGTGANPTIQTYILCGAGTTAASTNNPDPMYVTMEATYYFKFYNAANLTGSSLAQQKRFPHDDPMHPARRILPPKTKDESWKSDPTLLPRYISGELGGPAQHTSPAVSLSPSSSVDFKDLEDLIGPSPMTARASLARLDLSGRSKPGSTI